MIFKNKFTSLIKNLIKNRNHAYNGGINKFGTGTSLIDQILSKHLNIKALGELECLGDSINKLDLINSEFQRRAFTTLYMV